MDEREQKIRDQAEALCSQISDFLNAYGQERAKALVACLSREHRTLQQSFTRFCMRWFERLASDEHGHDGRNQASVDLAKKIMAMPDRDRALPLV